MTGQNDQHWLSSEAGIAINNKAADEYMFVPNTPMHRPFDKYAKYSVLAVHIYSGQIDNYTKQALEKHENSYAVTIQIDGEVFDFKTCEDLLNKLR